MFVLVACSAALPPRFAPAMGAQFTDDELDNTQKWKSQRATPLEIHARLVKNRKRRPQTGQVLTTARRFLKGDTFKRSGA